MTKDGNEDGGWKMVKTECKGRWQKATMVVQGRLEVGRLECGKATVGGGSPEVRSVMVVCGRRKSVIVGKGKMVEVVVENVDKGFPVEGH